MSNILTNNINPRSGNKITIGGVNDTVSIAGTLSYEDISNVDSVGIITARNGIEVTDKGVQVGTGATVDSAADNVLTFLTNGSESLRITSDGQININASSESAGGRVLIKHNVDYTTTDFDDSPTLYLLNDDRTTGVSESAIVFAGRNSGGSTYRAAISGNGSTGLKFYTTNNAESDDTPAMIIGGGGNIGVGTVSPFSTNGTNLEVFHDNSSGASRIILNNTDSSGLRYYIQSQNDGALSFGDFSNSERLRIDSSGRLLLGTSSSRAFVGSALNSQFQIEGTNDDTSIASITRNSNNTGAGRLIFAKSRGTVDSAVTVVQSGDNLGSILFEGTDGTDTTTAASIDCAVDGTPGSDDMPGRITFSTTADGGSSPLERLKIDSSGTFSGQANYIERVTSLLYARLQSHGGCSSGGPGASFTEFDSGEVSFICVSRTTTTATSGYSFIGDGNGNAFTFFVGCGDNPVFSRHSKDSDAPEYRSWVLVDDQFVSALGGAPTNATRTSLPTTP